jgi:hypothetical protein
VPVPGCVFIPANVFPQSERARRIVSSGALNGSASNLIDSGMQRALSSPVQEQLHAAPSPTPVPVADLSKRVRFQDSPPATFESPAAAPAPAVPGWPAAVPVPTHPTSSLEARNLSQPQHTTASTSPTAADSAPLHRAPADARSSGAASVASAPANAAQVPASRPAAPVAPTSTRPTPCRTQPATLLKRAPTSGWMPSLCRVLAGWSACAGKLRVNCAGGSCACVRGVDGTVSCTLRFYLQALTPAQCQQVTCSALAAAATGESARRVTLPVGPLQLTPTSSCRWSWNALQSGDAAWGFDNK